MTLPPPFACSIHASESQGSTPADIQYEKAQDSLLGQANMHLARRQRLCRNVYFGILSSLDSM